MAHQVNHNNPFYRKMTAVGLRAPNGGHFVEHPYSGMESGYPVHATTKSFAITKLGVNNLPSYKGGIHEFNKRVTPQIRDDYKECVSVKKDPVGCGIRAIRQATQSSQPSQSPVCDSRSYRLVDKICGGGC